MMIKTEWVGFLTTLTKNTKKNVHSMHIGTSAQWEPMCVVGVPMWTQGNLMCANGEPVCAHGCPMCTCGVPMCAHGSPMCTHGSPMCTHVTPMCTHVIPICTHGSPMCTHENPMRPDVHAYGSHAHTWAHMGIPYLIPMCAHVLHMWPCVLQGWNWTLDVFPLWNAGVSQEKLRCYTRVWHASVA